MRIGRNLRRKLRLVVPAIALAILSLPLATTSWAAERAVVTVQWHGDIHRFHERDLHRWRGGHWVHDWHGGRFGWWWIVGPTWYYYPAPVYPYPDPYQPPTAPLPPAQAPTQYWYFCPSSQSYYPYVATCPQGWLTVVPGAIPAAPVSPQAPPPPAGPPAPAPPTMPGPPPPPPR